ncbi:MAG TPA: HAMP domain-containing sensor histidine kinase, partial [Longimicrobiaceae bacterium]|nr:HAMP domain-containing sensor histidine kinase [Longimicrobiaceae bacterium]
LTSPLHEVRSPLDQARHEERLLEWLDDRGVRLANEEALTESPLSLELLEAVASSVEPEKLSAALNWVAAGCTVLALSAEIRHAATRISELVKAVKGFTQLDGDTAPQPVDVEKGLTQTLTVMRTKARQKSVRVTISAPPELPRAHATSGELNQIWANLLDNAVDAVAEGGSVEAIAEADGERVTVRIVDDGPGISGEVQARIFDPFFTTKPVGQGTGLGLDIVRRLVDQNGGTIDVTSKPGRTEFRVSFPIGQENRGEDEA